MKGIWKALPRPISILAPMENVTDTVFRRIVAECGRPDMFFTEFTNVDWMDNRKKWKNLSHRLQFTEAERPLIAQIWGNDPEYYFKGAQLIREMGFDGLDINMGCPAPKIRRKASCSGLINYPGLASELIKAAQEGAGEMPVSVKTRLGFSRVQTEEWCGFLLQHQLDALIVHGRIATEMSHFPADWDELGKVVALRDGLGVDTCIVGNGDVRSFQEIKDKHREYGVDGVMVGRGIFHEPYLFHPTLRLREMEPQARLELLLRHTRLFVETWGESKDFNIMKKFFKIYSSDFEGALELREELMKQRDLEGVEQLLAQRGWM